MSDLRPRSAHRRPLPIARHGKLPKRGPLGTIAKIVASIAAVVAIASVGIAAVAAGDIAGSAKPAVTLVNGKGEVVTPPSLSALNGAFNVLLVGSDHGNGEARWGSRGENLNDVTMLLHVSKDHKSVVVLSFPRDMNVPIPSCPDGKGGSYSAMSSQKINVSLSYGGLACTVLTVESLTGFTIPYAALIQFDGVIAMSNAVGGVPVCINAPIYDPDSPVWPSFKPLSLPAGTTVLKGGKALAFLRTRHGVGDGSDLGRISNQQVYLSSLIRTVMSSDTLTNPLKLYSLAKAAVSHMELSESMSNPTTLAQMVLAIKDVPLSQFAFVQFPTHYPPGNTGGVDPTWSSAHALLDAIKADRPVKVTGGTGPSSWGSQEEKSPAPTSARTGSPTPGATSGSSAVPLPTDVYGQTADTQTCSTAYQF